MCGYSFGYMHARQFLVPIFVPHWGTALSTLH